MFKQSSLDDLSVELRNLNESQKNKDGTAVNATTADFF